MRPLLAAVVIAAVALGTTSGAAAESMPSGAIGALFGGVAGTGADAARLGIGIYRFGMQASWQPTTTEATTGWTLRWATLFGSLYSGNAAKVDSTLRTVQMDLTLGVRYRPGKSRKRYLTLRGGAELLRTNEPIPPEMHRAFLGGVAIAGLDQYVGGFMLNVDVRYGLIATGPESLAVLLGIGFAGP